MGCALYPSTTDGLRSEAELFGARSSPFARHEVGSIPTPFGVLHLTAFYDASLDVGAAMRARAERMALLGTGAMAMAMAMAMPTMTFDVSVSSYRCHHCRSIYLSQFSVCL